MALSFTIEHEPRTPGGRLQLRGLSMRPQEFLRLPRAEPWGQVAGCLSFRFNPSSPEHAYIQENDRLGKLPDYSMAQLCHNLDPAGGPGGVLLGSCPHLGLSMGLGQEVSCSQHWLPKACLAPSASPATYCKARRPGLRGDTVAELWAWPPFRSPAGACPPVPILGPGLSFHS